MKKLLAIAILLAFTLPADAQLFRRFRSPRYAPSVQEVSREAIPFSEPAPAFRADAEIGASVEALDEVNAARAQRGLRPFIRDDGLTVAAKSAASYRAARLMAGHTPNDFAHVPAGSSATAAGCAAWPASLGWGSCCAYENWTYAGAAYCVGADGRRFMHLYVR